jgi:hypothetical protein
MSGDEGAGPFASVSDCPRGQTVMLHPTEEAARKAIAFIDRLGCSGCCRRMHRLVHILDMLEEANV